MPQYFEGWLQYAKEARQKQLSSKPSEELADTTFDGFGKQAEEAWTQWLEFLDAKLLDMDEEDEFY